MEFFNAIFRKTQIKRLQARRAKANNLLGMMERRLERHIQYHCEVLTDLNLAISIESSRTVPQFNIADIISDRNNREGLFRMVENTCRTRITGIKSEIYHLDIKISELKEKQ